MFGLLVAGGALLAQDPVPLVAPTLHQKFTDYSIVAFGPRAVLSPIAVAGLRMVNPLSGYPRDWRFGTRGFGRDYGSILASLTAMRTGRFAAGALLHEDFRYRPSASNNPLARTWHALAFTFVDKSDSGRDRVAVANFLGAGAGGLVGNLYLPPGMNSWRHAENRAMIEVSGIAVHNVYDEFRPEIAKLAHRLHLPFSAAPVPKWWTKLD